MKKVMKKIWKSKDEGSSFISMFSVVITIMAIALAAVIFSSYMANLDKKTQVDSIARKYLLIMETEGYLSNANKTRLTQELNDVGFVTNSDSFNGSTMGTPAGYGNDISLVITGKLKVYKIQFENFMEADWNTGTVDLTISKKSIAKQ